MSAFSRRADEQQALRLDWIALLSELSPETSAKVVRVFDPLDRGAKRIFEPTSAPIAPPKRERLRWTGPRAGFVSPDPDAEYESKRHAVCVCEQDDACLLYYRSFEYGFELSDNVLSWIVDHVAQVEASCRASLHYQNVLLDELLARDVSMDSDNAGYYDEFFDAQHDDDAEWVHRFESDEPVADQDFATRTRIHEFHKRRELFELMLKLGLDPQQEAAWVKRRIEIKRQDAIREKAAKEKASWWTEGFELLSESNLRLRAYSSCIASLKKRFKIK